MNINAYYIKHGTAGLARLADAAQTKLSYLKQLIYSEKKSPSMKMAARLVKASNNELTLEGLANPVKRLPRDVNPTTELSPR